jgi:hypothetical protein
MKSVKLSDIPLIAIAKVVDYLESDEEKGYYGEDRTHIVHSVRRLKKFLYAIDPNNPLERMRARQEKHWQRVNKCMREVLGGDEPDLTEANRDT